MVEAIIGLSVAILSLVAHCLAFRSSAEGRAKQEAADVDRLIQEMRKDLEGGDSDRVAAAIAEQHARVQSALRGDRRTGDGDNQQTGG